MAAWVPPATFLSAPLTAPTMNVEVRDHLIWLKAALDLITGATIADSGDGTRLSVTRATDSATGYESKVTGDTVARLAVSAGGALQWGSGAANSDHRLQRTSYAGKVQLGLSDPDSAIGGGIVATAIGLSTTARAQFAIRLSTDTDYRVILTNSPDGSAGSGGLLFGPGTASPDVMLYRSATNHLSLGSGDVLAVGGTQVLTARQTGWSAASNTKARTTFDTTTVTLPNLAARVGALIDDLITHGIIGS